MELAKKQVLYFISLIVEHGSSI